MKKYLLIAFIIALVTFGLYMHQKPIPLEDLKEAYTDEYSQFIELIGLDVHYKKKGTGPAILLIHGTSSSLHTWEQWESELSKNYTTYSIDMQGGGLTTPPPDHDYSIASYIELIDAFVQELDIDSFHLIGNSLGGHTAWAYAANSQLSSRVQKLVLVDPSGFAAENREKPLVFRLAQFDFLFNIVESLNTAPFVKKSLEEVFYNDDLITEEMLQRYIDLGFRAGNREAFFYKVRQLEYGKKSDLANIQCPTLILWGEEDMWIPLELADIFNEHIPNSQLIVYPECGHIPMEEIPEQSIEDVVEFFLK